MKTKTSRRCRECLERVLVSVYGKGWLLTHNEMCMERLGRDCLSTVLADPTAASNVPYASKWSQLHRRASHCSVFTDPYTNNLDMVSYVSSS